MKLLPYINAIYSISSYGASFVTHTAGGLSMPVAVSVELTNQCNLKCPGCATGSGILTRPKGFMNIPTAEKIASSLKDYLLSVNLYFQGEPMLHPQFFEITERFRGINSVISTNGHFLSRENCKNLALSGLKKIIISYDGVTPEIYSHYRKGGDLGRVNEGIRLLAHEIKAKRASPKLELLFLVGRHNENDVAGVSAFARSINAAFSIKSMQILNVDEAGKWVPQNGKLSRYERKNDVYVPKKTPLRGCLRMWTTPVITWDGNIVPCCYDKDAGYIMGNINEQPFREIWYGEKHLRFLRQVIRNRSSHDICSECPQGMKLFF